MNRIDLLKPLANVGKENAGLVGGKAASLGEMIKAGFPVPNGFALTAETFKKYHGKKLPDKIIKQIYSVFDQLKTKRVAVRSSALAEDSSDASWAGQFESFLNVERENLLDAIQKCWASGSSDRAKAYATQHQGKDLSVAVVVQAMVDSDAAGVMFSVNPLTNDDSEIVIESSYGLGESVVQGKVTPDNFVISKKDFTVLKKEIQPKETQLIFKNGRNEEEPVSDNDKNKSSISGDTVKQLAELGAKIENHYGSPQDIEWGVAKDKIFILQARPITTLALKTAKTETKAKPVLSGLGAAPGVAVGKVRIIEALGNLQEAEKGEILVAPLTTPEFTEAFSKMKGVVTNSGGMASHAAIVSRELDIPAVVGTNTATKELKTGDLVTIDGYSGKVYKGNIKITVSNEISAEPDHAIPSTGNDIDDLINSLVADPMDTREFWPLAPGSLMSYFDVDQAIDMHDKLQQLIKEGRSFKDIAKLFKRAQLVRYFIVNSGLVGIKLAHGLKIAPISIDDQVEFARWLSEILKQYQPDDPYNLKGKNALWSDEAAINFNRKHKWHSISEKARNILGLAAVQLFTLNWSFYGDYYGPIGHALHGPYQLPDGKVMLIREYFRAPTEIWGLGSKLPYDHLIVAQQFEGVDIFVNYSNRVLNQSSIAKYSVGYHIIQDGNAISIDELQQILKQVENVTQRQTAYVERLTDLDKVRKWAQLAYYAHKDFYLHFGKHWYNKEAVEWSIKEFGDRFIKDENLAKPQNRSLEYRKKMWDPRNDYYPGSES